MQKWEYCVLGPVNVYAGGFGIEDCGLIYLTSNGQKLSKVSTTHFGIGSSDNSNKIAKLISDLGDQG